MPGPSTDAVISTNSSKANGVRLKDDLHKSQLVNLAFGECEEEEFTTVSDVDGTTFLAD